MKDDYAIVLDFLAHGHAAQTRSYAVAQVIGEKFFNLLEVVPREDASLKINDRVYIGDEERDQIRSIKRKLSFRELTGTAQSELTAVIEELIAKNEARFVEFFNSSGPVTTRQHQLELLPGIGKKHMWQIIEERKKKKFESLEDVKERVTLLPHPKKAIVKRIMDELEEKTKWYIFTSPPRREERRY